MLQELDVDVVPATVDQAGTVVVRALLVDGAGAGAWLEQELAGLVARWPVPVAVLVGEGEAGLALPPSVTPLPGPAWWVDGTRRWLQSLDPGDTARWAWIRRTVNHDLRGPLAVILGQCEMLEAGIRGELSGGQARAIQAIRRNAERLDDELGVLRDALGPRAGGGASTE